jgi:MSHA biogenesis protein MshQ
MSRAFLAKLSRWLALPLGLLLSAQALAVTYTFNVGTINGANPAVSGSPSICSGAWSRSGNSGAYVFTCSGNIAAASGDVLTISANSSITVVAGNSTISLNNNTVGTTNRNITLQTSSGSLTSTGTNTIYGSVVSASGPISLSATTLSGSVTGTGTASLSGGSVGGNVNVSGDITTNSTIISGTLTSSFGVLNLTGGSVVGNASTGGAVTTNGVALGGTLTSGGIINLTGGSVVGLVRSTCCTVTTNGTNLSGGARSDSSSISITGGSIAGAFYANNNPATFSGVTMTSGSITGASTVSVSNSTLGSAESKVTVTSVSGPVTLNNTTAFGDFTAPNYATIEVNSPSTVTGTCVPGSTPANACNANVAPVCFTDNFNRSSLGADDWVVTSRRGSFGVPRIVNNRLRLTDNSAEVATAATLQRLLPANSNYVQVQFTYNAYGGNGADGVAVVFSDASVAPQPGAFGGPLGYGTKGSADTTGFAGGWLGVGIDEYGNFSNEGGTGSVGARQDSVGVRGSGAGTQGYRYLAGTGANLNPGIDISGSTPGPGHIYRITLDSTVVGKTMVRVERKVGAADFTTLISSFDARSGSGQAAVPNDFYLSLTGSTGGSNNIHELDDLQICAARMNPIGQQIDHFRFTYSGQALTCNPQDVTVQACLNASCSSLYTDLVSVTLTPTTGWSAVAPATLSGGNVVSFTGGSALVRLQRTTVGNLSIGVSNSSPTTKPLSVPVCSTANCTISYADSGFLLDVPNMLAAKPTDASITAVRKADNAASCVPAFAGVTRTIGFTAAYVDPNSGTQPVVVNGSSISAAVTNLSLSFDGNGRAPLTVRYNDAGQRSLSASYSGSAGTGDSGLQMNGTDLFVSKPYGLCLQTASTLAANTNCNDASCAVFPGGIRAGDNFPLTIRAVGWEADGEALTAAQLCSGNITTPNFRLNGIRLESAVVAPSGGENGVLTPNTYNHVLGNSTIANRSVSEVGVFTITATPPAGGYLDAETVSGGSSALVGRFIPAYLSASGNASLTTSCGSAFTYQGQPMGFAANRQPTLTLAARNRSGDVTRNYDRGAFWKLPAPSVGTYSSVTGSLGRDARLARQGADLLSVSGANDGDGARTYSWLGEQLLYQPANAPSSDDYPFAAQIRQTFTAASLREVDQLQEVCYGTGAGCQSFSYDFTVDAASNLGSQIRLGRLRLGNAHGPELQGLGLPLVLESWQDVAGGSFQPEGLDNCTTAASLGAAQLDQFSGNLAAGETTASLNWPLDPEKRQVLLSAPGAGNDGSAQVSFPAAPSWLHYPWDGANRTAARGLATFGIYKGAAPLIFRREVYR